MANPEKSVKTKKKYLENWLPQSFHLLLFIIFLLLLVELLMALYAGIKIKNVFYIKTSILYLIANTTCLIATIGLLRYKKWGFWMLVIGICLYNAWNIIIFHHALNHFFQGFIIVLISYALLKLKGRKSMWNQLK